MRKRHALIALGLLACVALTFSVASLAQRGRSNQTQFATLSGANELSEEGERGAGDRNGRGAFSAIFDGNQICYGIQVRNIATPSASHIHRGTRNQIGPVVFPLTHPTTGDPGASAACAEIPSRLARAIRRNPSRYYVNVHNADFPDGAVRGQLTGRTR